MTPGSNVRDGRMSGPEQPDIASEHALPNSPSDEPDSLLRDAASIGWRAIAIPLASVGVMFGAFEIAELFDYRVPTVLFVGALLSALAMVRIALFPFLGMPLGRRLFVAALAGVSGTSLGWLLHVLMS
jgi:hypothetical protein